MGGDDIFEYYEFQANNRKSIFRNSGSSRSNSSIIQWEVEIKILWTFKKVEIKGDLVMLIKVPVINADVMMVTVCNIIASVQANPTKCAGWDSVALIVSK